MNRIDVHGEKDIFLNIQESTEFYFDSKSKSEIKLIIRNVSCDLNFYFKENNSISNIQILFLCDQDLNSKAKIFFLGNNNKANLDVKGIASKDAKVSFDAGVDIASHAEQTDVYISERGIIFDNARITFFPNLQIAQNNVKAGHAASIRNYREDDLFYISSRGLNEIQSKNLLLEGFLKDFEKFIDAREVIGYV